MKPGITALLGVLSFLFLSGPAFGESDLSPIEPKPCFGLQGDQTTSPWSVPERCPVGYAIFSVGAPSGPLNRHPSRIHTSIHCCPLPSSDILTGETVTADSRCPKNFVATGLIFRNDKTQPNPLVCTRIDARRFRLGPAVPAVYYGFSSMYWKEKRRIMKSEIPPGLRYGVGRRSRTRWRPNGCIGYPFGSLLVEKSGKRCANFKFRQLQFAGKAGDPPSGAPVPMIADCELVTDLLKKNPKCIRFNTLSDEH